jgi:arabidopsis histidine kinase 2/3/4 (cytokinin receptor)
MASLVLTHLLQYLHHNLCFDGPGNLKILLSNVGMLDMLLGTDLTMTQKDFAQTAQMCGRALITLINDVLDRAKIEAGKLELEAVPFDLRSLMDDVISLFSSKSREKCIEVSYC